MFGSILNSVPQFLILKIKYKVQNKSSKNKIQRCFERCSQFEIHGECCSSFIKIIKSALDI